MVRAGSVFLFFVLCFLMVLFVSDSCRDFSTFNLPRNALVWRQMKFLIAVLVSTLAACTRYYPVAVPNGHILDLAEIASLIHESIGKNSILESVSVCGNNDSNTFNVDSMESNGCYVAFTSKENSCFEYMHLIQKNDETYFLVESKIVTICTG